MSGGSFVYGQGVQIPEQAHDPPSLLPPLLPPPLPTPDEPPPLDTPLGSHICASQQTPPKHANPTQSALVVHGDPQVPPPPPVVELPSVAVGWGGHLVNSICSVVVGCAVGGGCAAASCGGMVKVGAGKLPAFQSLSPRLAAVAKPGILISREVLNPQGL